MPVKFISLLFLGILTVCQPAHAQHTTIDSVMSDLYESISFTPNSNPDYDTFQSLFKANSRLISVGDTTSNVLTPQDYKQIMTQQRKSGKIIAFEEYELHRKTERYGNIAHVFSTYQTKLKTPEGTESARGINSIQLMKTDSNWKVVSLIWYEENGDHPLPQQYLSGKDNQ